MNTTSILRNLLLLSFAGLMAACSGSSGNNNNSSSDTGSKGTVGQNGVAAISLKANSTSSISVGQSAAFTVTLPSTTPALTGTVTLTEGGVAVGTATAISGTTVTLSTAALTAGSHNVAVVYSGDSKWNSFTSATVPLTVSKGNPTSIKVASDSATSAVLNQSIKFTATLAVPSSAPAPTGMVDFRDTTASVDLGSASITGTTATLPTTALSAGSHSITAEYSGDSNYLGMISEAAPQYVNQGKPIGLTVTSSQKAATVGNQVTFTATLALPPSTFAPNGTMIVSDETSILYSGSITGMSAAFAAALPAGSHTITAIYRDDSNWASITSPVLLQDVSQHQLVWQDEFDAADGTPPDPNIWSYDLGTGNSTTGAGWGNQELETYTSRTVNVQQKSGYLQITAQKETHADPSDGITRNYTSARIKTQGKPAYEPSSGRIEARIQLPAGAGIWPAFWMLGYDFPANPWPSCGEIDVMENIGDPLTIYSTLHFPGDSGAGVSTMYPVPASEDVSKGFHVYAVEWTANNIKFYFDNNLIAERTPSDLPSGAWVFNNKPLFIILNLAVGGNWPGPPNANTVFPQTMLVDYMRVYQLP